MLTVAATPPARPPLKKLTPTQQRLLDAIADGFWHSQAELRLLLNDELAGQSTLRAHVCFLRAAVRKRGQDILCVIRNKYTRGYQLVRLVGAAAAP